MLLAGDLGGTKTLLGLFDEDSRRPSPVDVRGFTTLKAECLGALVREFLETSPLGPVDVRAACVGVAGPVVAGRAELTNVPWSVSETELAESIGGAPARLVNDLVALGHGVGVLADDEVRVLQSGRPDAEGNGVLLAPGTGLGQALLVRRGGRFEPLPSEGGHTDFAARTEREIEFVRELIARFGRADVERVCSGPGLANLASFTHAGTCSLLAPDSDEADVPAHVSAMALAGRCEACSEALDMFVSALGAVAGNLALHGLATGGVFVGGGIPPRILPALEAGGFTAAFVNKPPMTALLERMRVTVILNPEAGLLGAAVCAGRL